MLDIPVPDLLVGSEARGPLPPERLRSTQALDIQVNTCYISHVISEFSDSQELLQEIVQMKWKVITICMNFIQVSF